MKRYSRVYGPLLVALTFLSVVVTAIYVNRERFPWFNPAGVIASSERTIFFIILGISAFVVIPVFTLLIVFALRYRAGNKKATYKPEWSENRKLEFIWWGIPIFIIMIVGTISWISTHELDPYKAINSDKKQITVQVVALEWKWLFIYPEHDVATVNRLELPVNTPIHLELSADAPMSAFWVPALGSQIYSMNGMSTQLHLMATRRGTFTGYNTMINGEGYAKMNFDVPVVKDFTFNDWVDKVKGSHAVLDEAEYKKLMKPGVVDGSREYRLKDNKLYDTILMKYMMPTAEKKSEAKSTKQSTQKDSADTKDMNMNMDMDGMDMHDMKGME